MLTLNDGRKELYQWDTGRTATVNVECDTVHFSNLKYGKSVPVEVKEGKVAIPNQLLLNGAPLYCWAFATDNDGGYTKKEQTIEVIKRAKPSEYGYMETEVINIQTAVKNALEEAKESGDFKGEKGDAGQIKFIVVAELPQIGDETAIYLLPSDESQEQNAYDEYIYTNGVWEKIGGATVEVNLDNYATKQYVDDGFLAKDTSNSARIQAYAKTQSGGRYMISAQGGEPTSNDSNNNYLTVAFYKNVLKPLLDELKSATGIE